MNAENLERVRKPFFTPGVFVLLGFMAVGFAFGLARFLTGLGTITNLTNYYPWGIWIAIDVACGVALAAGGFTTAALIDIFGKEKYQPLLRPAILTAWLGYTFVAIGLMFDLGRYWNIWRPAFNWQGNSVLFEVAMCVMGYLTVLTVEMSPALLEGLKKRINDNEWGAAILRIVEKPINIAYRVVKVVLPLFIIAGVVLSCMHQSSLGAVLLISPTKIHSFWFTPILPLLFLLSAVMVGFPMVIMESMIASRSLERKPEMHILAPLARYIPWMLIVYAAFKFGDLLLRLDTLKPGECPRCIVAFVVEVGIGVVLPFILLVQKKVRRSPNWLFFSSLLVVLGVALNRINAYLVAYSPPYTETTYFPSIGEIAVTTALICTIMFLYRFFISFFPIMPRAEEEKRYESRISGAEDVSNTFGWVFRILAAVLLLSFVILYALVHEEAVSGNIEAVNWANKVEPVKHKAYEVTAREHSFRPEGYKNLYVLNNDILNSRTDYYEPVRFTHRTHDVFTDGNCGVCHHRFSYSEDDRTGYDVAEFHAQFDVRVRGACSTCHDMEEITISKCSTCHWMPNEPDNRDRLGLKGAYHRQCMDCHNDQPPSAYAPVDCVSCHHKHVPDHSELVNLRGQPSPSEITTRCLECHYQTGQDILETAHWNWKGHSPKIREHEHDINLGVPTVLNNYMIGVGPNAVYCASCHIGFGWTDETGIPHPEDIDCVLCLDDPTKIDCLVCHDSTGTYRKDPAAGGMPAATVDLLKVAEKVDRPSRERCGSCHFYSDGGPNTKHGDLEPILKDPPDDFDVHMGKYDLRCQDCHLSEDHKIAGMSLSAPASEGRVFCSRCHSKTPHGITGPLSRHLDDHIKAIACETCHIPMFAREFPTQTFLDYSNLGENWKVQPENLETPFYDKDLGGQVWENDVVPVYQWYDGTRKAYVIGDKIDPSETVVLNRPLGERIDPGAKVFPFKVHKARQPYDTVNNHLAIPKLWKGLWEHGDWSRALEQGMKNLGIEYSGEFDFVETEMYTAIHHSVVPAKKSLGCTDCHDRQAVKCGRCHESADLDQPEHTRMVYPEIRDRMDFKALGYSNDPALIGGRFFVSPGRGKPPK